VIAVVDTSVLVGLATLNESELDETLVERLLDVAVHVPDIIDVEFHHALRGLLIGKKISAERAEHARVLFADTPKVRLPTQPLADRIWSLRNNLGACDASFIALAEALEAPLITADSKQAAASGHQARVESY
jgi:predicted nucleic acid-binding protein